MLSDEILIAAKNGDAAAIDKVFEDSYKEVYNIAKCIVCDEYEAQDVTQNVFEKLFKAMCTMKTPDTFYAWLHKITENEARMFLRKKRNNVVYVDDADDAENILTTDDGEYTEILPLENIDKKENDRIIFALMGEMPEKYKSVLMMRFYADLSYAEISEKLEINIGTVRSRLSYAKNLLMDKIENFEKKHGIRLHTTDIFDNLGDIISAAARNGNTPPSVYDTLKANANTYAELANTSATAGSSVSSGAVSAVTTGAVNSVSSGFANSVAAKISMVTSAVALVMIGVVIGRGSTNVDVQKPQDIAENSVVSEISETDIIIPPLPEPYGNEQPERTEPERVPQESSEVQSSEVQEPVIQTSTVIEKVPEVHTEYVTVPQTVSTSAAARDYTKYEDITYGDYGARVYYVNNEAMLTSYSGKEENVVMPSYVTYNGEQVPVTRMDRNLFNIYQYKNEYENGLGEIPPDICMKSVVLPEHLSEIPNRAFKQILSLQSVSGGNEVIMISTEAFASTGLKELDFSKYFPILQEIDYHAFSDCSELKNVVMPTDCIYIDDDAFEGCTNLTDITVIYDPDKLISLPEFYYVNLHLILKGDTVNISGPMLKGLNERNTEYFSTLYLEPENKNAVLDGKIGNLLSYVEAEQIYLPEGLTEIRKDEFNNPDFNVIVNLIIPDSVTTIDKEAFRGFGGYVELSGSNKKYKMNGDVLYDNDGNMIYFPSTKTIDVEKQGKMFENYALIEDINYFYLSDNVTDLDEVTKAFPNIAYISVSEDNPVFMSHEGAVYSKDGTELLYYPNLDRTMVELICDRINYDRYGSEGDILPGFHQGAENVEVLNVIGRLENLGGLIAKFPNLERVVIALEDYEIEPYSIGYKKVQRADGTYEYVKIKSFDIQGYGDNCTAKAYADANGFEYIDEEANIEEVYRILEENGAFEENGDETYEQDEEEQEEQTTDDEE